MIPAAAVLAVAMHPFIIALNSLIVRLYPIAPDLKRAMNGLHSKFESADLGLLILCVAVVPAICEELAFRGFILSAFRSLGNNRRAIIVSAPSSASRTASCSNRSTPACWGLCWATWPCGAGACCPA